MIKMRSLFFLIAIVAPLIGAQVLLIPSLEPIVHRVSIGNEIELPCNHSRRGQELPWHVIWDKFGPEGQSQASHLALPGYLQMTNGTLLLGPIGMQHQGLYLCTVKYDDDYEEYYLHQVTLESAVKVIGTFKCPDRSLITVSVVVSNAENFESLAKTRNPQLSQCTTTNQRSYSLELDPKQGLMKDNILASFNPDQVLLGLNQTQQTTTAQDTSTDLNQNLDEI